MLNIRLATLDNMKNVFDLSNDNIVRQNSIHTEKIEWNNHIKWFKNKINSKDSIFYIAEDNNNFIGYCRLDKEKDYWVITIHISDKYRGKGYGSKIIKEICAKNPDKKLKALVKKENSASYNMFLNCGFKNNGCETIVGVELWSLTLKRKNIIAISNEIYDKTSLFDKKDVVFIKNKNDLTYKKLKEINPKYVFFPHWSYIIKPEIYENFNCIIFHMTDLPFGRGGSPLQNLISRGIYKTKISAIKCVKELDAGDVYLKQDLDISYGNAQEIYKKAGEIVSSMIDEIIEKNPVPIPQKGEIVEFKRRKPEESNIKDLDNINKIYDYIRMLDANGYPKAFLETENVRFEFNSAKLEDGKITANVEIKVKNE